MPGTTTAIDYAVRLDHAPPADCDMKGLRASVLRPRAGRCGPAAIVFAFAMVGCGGGGGAASGGPEGYGVTSNVGTLEEDELQNESANQDPFADNPDPIPN
ncbi:MAG: hypothetical protein ACYTFH_07915 [Planctomycetota bacterium]